MESLARLDGGTSSMTKWKLWQTAMLGLAAFAGTITASPALANSAAAEYFRSRADRTAVPALLSQDDRDYYKQLFVAIEREEWSSVQAMLAKHTSGPLHSVAQSQYYLAASSPRAPLQSLSDLLVAAPELPWSEQLGKLALKRGASELPALPYAQRMQTLPGMSKRIKPRAIADGTMPDSIALAIQERIKNDDPGAARVLLDGIDSQLSPATRSEWRQRVGWAYYIENDDANARQLSISASDAAGGMGGAWAAEAMWTAGLAAWRMNDCAGAGASFEQAAAMAQNDELGSAANFWASRAWLRCRKPEKVAAALRGAARSQDTLYGMLAAETLGLRSDAAKATGTDFSNDDWQQLRAVSNVRIAVQLAEIGEEGLADEVLRYQARIGDPAQYAPLSRLARDLGLPATQLWMAYNAPAGARPDDAARFPAPKWVPANGWKVDPALLFAHSLQESNFRTSVTSPAGATGLMQVMPGTARDMARAMPEMAGQDRQLDLPRVNLAFGQTYLAQLSHSDATRGLLPKVIAAYNAGPAPIGRWNSEIRDSGDPLLWMESIPYWETRGYVAIVMRNYWMYERQAGGVSQSRMGLVQGLWPKFPGLSGATSVRITANGG